MDAHISAPSMFVLKVSFEPGLMPSLYCTQCQLKLCVFPEHSSQICVVLRSPACLLVLTLESAVTLDASRSPLKLQHFRLCNPPSSNTPVFDVNDKN